MVEASARMIRKKEPVIEAETPDMLDVPVVTPPIPWWDTRGSQPHPMTDSQFVHAFCDYVLSTTEDHSLTALRNRAYRFIRNFMSQELEAELTKYREVHP